MSNCGANGGRTDRRSAFVAERFSAIHFDFIVYHLVLGFDFYILEPWIDRDPQPVENGNGITACRPISAWTARAPHLPSPTSLVNT